MTQRHVIYQLFCFLLFLTFVFCCSKGMGQEIGIVIPNSLENVEGNDGDPVNVVFSQTGMRYQQVFPASQFAALPDSHHTLTAFVNRPDGSITSPYTHTSDYLIRMSTTQRNVGELDLVFDNNIGPDETVVYDGINEISSSVIGPPGGPKEFDLLVPFQVPFSYDPSQGNLLMDILVRGQGKTAGLDFHISDDNPTQYVWSLNRNATVASSGGNRTSVIQLVFVPEPSSTVLIVISFVGLLSLRRRA